MKIQGTLIVRTFRGMPTASLWIPVLSNSLRLNQSMAFHPTSTLTNPQIARLCFRPIIPNTFSFSSATATINSARRWSKEARTALSGNTTRVVKGSSEHSDNENSRFNYPRPQEVPWQKELSNKVHLIGKIGLPVKFKRTKSGKACASTSLAVQSDTGGEILWFTLIFWNELAETAAWHLKMNDSVYVSGFFGLETTIGEDDKLQRYKVIATTLNFIKNTYPDFSQQAVVNKTLSRSFSRQTGKNAEVDTALIQSLWHAYFSCPLEWWDNRTNKKNPKAPDFKHKYTGAALWIENKSNPPWVKSQLAVREPGVKVLEEWGKGGPSARSQGSLSSLAVQEPVVKVLEEWGKGKNAEIGTALIQSLWRAFFSSPLEWWDNRTNKKKPKAPDFKHKYTGEVLWIENKSNPPWVKSQLAVLEPRMKVLEEWGKGGPSARSQGSLSSSQDNAF